MGQWIPSLIGILMIVYMAFVYYKNKKGLNENISN